MNHKIFFRTSIIYLLVLFLLFDCQKNRYKVSEIELNPVLQYGGLEDEGNSTIGGISDFIVSSKNEIVALDHRFCQIFFFDKKLGLIRKVGRKGKGPLELFNLHILRK